MAFLTPLYLLGGLLIALPIVLHWLRRDVAPSVPFTAVRLLRGSPINRSRRRRLRDLLLLAARVLALLLLAASFARPYVAGARGVAGATIIAVDRSFSMGAPGEMARARALARAAIQEAPGDRLAVVGFDEKADVLAPFGTAADARLAVDRIEPGFDATRYAAAFQKAAELAGSAGAPRVRLVLVSDLQRSGLEGGAATLPSYIELSLRDAEAPSKNLAVVEARMEALPPERGSHGEAGVTAVVRNFGGAASTADVQVESSGRVRSTRRVSIGAGASTTIDFGPQPAGPIAVRVTDPDGFAADNVRYTLPPARTLPRVLVVGGAAGSEHGFYVTRALQASGEDGPDFDVRSLGAQALNTLEPKDMSAQAVVVLLSTHGLDRRARALLPPFVASGGGLFIAAGPDVDERVLSTVLDWSPPLHAQDRAAGGVLAATNLRHPIFRPFDAVAANFGQVSFEHVWQIDSGKDWQTVARFTDGAPALVERTSGRGKVLLFASDLGHRWNDFPLHAVFVPFVQESIRYLGARPAPASSMLVDEVPAGVTRRPGVISLQGHPVAVNVDARESTLERLAPAEFSRSIVRTTSEARPLSAAAAAQTEGAQHYWQYGLLLMLGALIAESFVGSR
jgi:Aerotolerance regulator N-terminal/von Willebrand factor type A domain